MRVTLIAAMSRNRVIGVDNSLPWHLSADLRRFKAITLGKPIFMGRKTHESIGRPLPGRLNLILSRNPEYLAEGCVVVHTLDQALLAAAGFDELMVIGGSSLYQTMLPYANRLYLTLIDAEFEGDTFFPAIHQTDWREVERQEVHGDASVPFSYQFLVLERIVPSKRV